MKRFIVSLPFLIFAVAFIAGCKKSETDVLPIDRLKSILIGKDTLSIYVGEKRNVPLTISPSNYSLDSIRWNSSDTNVLSISKVGLLTGKKPGVTTVSVSNLTNTISINCKVTVKDSIEMGMIAYYPFHNSGKDSSGRVNDIAYYADIAATADRFGNRNSAFYLNGSTSYMMVRDKPELRLNNTDFTLNAWVKLDTYNSSYGNNLLTKHITGNDNGWAWGVTGSGGEAATGIVTFGPGGSSLSARGVKTVGLGQWHMVTATYKLYIGQITIYVDGELDTITNGIPSPKAYILADLYIGRDNPYVSDNGYVVRGAMDDVRIYNRLLTATQVKRLYTHKN
ncbi:LamG-like jellyroll fold domain-containing protein [Mucilaginibacter auburnensis]|uniref:Ig-like protein group 2 n=1 Tax=Mucilaginibacter auburnensis TaxID=1457233 RepID=A0A2H9VSH8_9SPHI|nr:LamG-like jellyroll fold domain-containing protein [Mucilaginibacter auburnensis]PJJ83768.1 Ig-like protein group 2 [Mucilaginibacter auburnensis]